MEYFENLIKKYDSQVDKDVLNSLKAGRTHQKCTCSQCRTLAAYFYLKNGGIYHPNLIKALNNFERKALMEYIFLRAVEAIKP